MMNKTCLLALGLLLILNMAAAAASPSTSSGQGRPNILLILSDDHAKKALSCYGNTDIQTPGLDRLASEGMRFEHALTPNSFCTPARAAVLTGKYSHKNGVTHLNQKFDGSQPTFPKMLQAAGYQTALFGKWHLLTQPTGFDHYCVMKMQGMPFNPHVWETGDPWIAWENGSDEWQKGGRKLSGYNNDAITDEALAWMKNRDESKPFCLLIHPKPPHAPYIPAERYEDFLEDVVIAEPATLLDDYKGRTPEAIADTMRSNRLLLIPEHHFRKGEVPTKKERMSMNREHVTRQLYQEYIKGYYRLVMGVDDNVARVLDYLEQSGLAANTLVIYTSDQGFNLGEHGFYNKQWMYEPALHQPLIVRFPGKIKAGTVHDSMVNHVDLAPTLLDFAGLPIPEDMQGHSLKPILEGRAEKVRDASYYHFYSHGKNNLPEMIGVRTATHKLIHYPEMKGSYQWELFDLERDPEEMLNLYSSPDHLKVREQLKTLLRRLIQELEDPVKAPNLVDTIDLFADNNLNQWTMAREGAWELKDGVLGVTDKPGGFIWSKNAYQNFEVSFEYKTSDKCNSGLFFRTDPKNPVQGGFEIQIASPGLYQGKHVAGALYDAKEPAEHAGKPDGQWNTMVVTCDGPHIKAVLNSKIIQEVNIDDWNTANQNPDGTKNKFKTPLKELPRKGHIGFQYHGHPVWFRNVKLKVR